MASAASGVSAKKSNRGLKAAVITAGIALLAALVALALALSGMIAIPGITETSGEIVLQGADEQGLDAFSDAPLATPAAAVTPAALVEPVTPAVAAPLSGGSVGLYGGTNDNSRCDPGQLIAFLAANPSKAKAWVDALNADPKLRWGDGSPLTTADIPAYVGQLTSLVLLKDTLVTNHGYKNSRATPFQATLQKGTAVLVDRFGTPRARCLCGNPLLPPKPVKTKPKIVGDVWDGFDINLTVNIIQVEIVINVFEAVSYPDGGTTIQVNAGQCDPANPSSCVFVWTPTGPTTGPDPGPTDSPAPTPTDTAGPVPDDGRPADAVAPEPWDDCSGILDNPQWVKYVIPNDPGGHWDLWHMDNDTCTFPVWQVRLDYDGDLSQSSGFTWMGWEGSKVVLTNKSSTLIFYGMIPRGGGPLQ